MTLAEELGFIPCPIVHAKGREVVGGALRLPFNGELSQDEMRMAEQCNLGPASWEEDRLEAIK